MSMQLVLSATFCILKTFNEYPWFPRNIEKTDFFTKNLISRVLHRFKQNKLLQKLRRNFLHISLKFHQVLFDSSKDIQKGPKSLFFDISARYWLWTLHLSSNMVRNMTNRPSFYIPTIMQKLSSLLFIVFKIYVPNEIKLPFFS